MAWRSTLSSSRIVPVRAGSRVVGVTFLATNYRPSLDVIRQYDRKSIENEKMAQVIAKSNEWGSKIPIGVFYQNEHIPTYQERIAARIPNYLESPPALQAISDAGGRPNTNIDRLLGDLRVDK